MRDSDIGAVVRVLRRAIRRWKVPAVGVVAGGLEPWVGDRRDPYLVLVSTLISLRTKDAVTEAASRRLFSLARTARGVSRLSPRAIEKAIYPAGFYRTKARTILRVTREILRRHGGRVPDTLDGLLALKGVGRKTANLVITLGYRKPGICVDIHVHRISNRLGYVRTKTPEQTEMALRAKLPGRYWLEVNDLLVTFGQNLCAPVSPWCSRCPVSRWCERVGVVRSR